MQVCLEAQLLNGTNASPANWSRCEPVIKDNKGFYISKTDFTGLDHSNLALIMLIRIQTRVHQNQPQMPMNCPAINNRQNK